MRELAFRFYQVIFLILFSPTQTIAALTQVLDGTFQGRGKLLAGSTGLLLPGMEARIVRDDGSEADFNEVGELWLKSPNVSPGYWNNEQANKETFVDGWLRSGDKFSVNEEGYFLYVFSAAIEAIADPPFWLQFRR